MTAVQRTVQDIHQTRTCSNVGIHTFQKNYEANKNRTVLVPTKEPTNSIQSKTTKDPKQKGWNSLAMMLEQRDKAGEAKGKAH